MKRQIWQTLFSLILFSIIVILYLFISQSAIAQMQFEWVRNYPNFQGHSAAIDSSGNIYSVGDSSSYLIVFKHTPNGILIWKRKLNYVKSNSPILVSTDKNKDLYVSCSNIAHNYVLTKFDSSGQLKWENILIYGGYDEPYSIAVDKAGFIYLTGETFNGITKCLTVKYTPQGDTLWTRINPEYVMGGNYVSIDDSGYVYVAGGYISSGGSYYYGTLKYDNNGNLKWFRKYSYQNTISRGLCVKPDNKGNCYVSGYITLYNGNFISGLIKYDYKGDSVWVRIFGDSLTYTSGSTNINFDDIGNIYLSSIYTLKYDTAGYLLWNIYNDSYSTSFAFHNNRIYFAGTSLWQGPDSLRIIERDEKGNLISQNYYPKSPSKLDLKFYDNSFYLIINSQDSLILMKFRTSPNSIVNNTTIISDYKLHQNFPNPFNSSTNISYSLRVKSLITLRIYDISGKEITTLVNGYKSAGEYKILFDAVNLSSGIYFYSMLADNKLIDTKKLIIVK
ncbi:MAG: T9SS type A sorting domain-containing protein [Ignavibacteria bacterium]